MIKLVLKFFVAITIYQPLTSTSTSHHITSFLFFLLLLLLLLLYFFYSSSTSIIIIFNHNSPQIYLFTLNFPFPYFPSISPKIKTK